MRPDNTGPLISAAHRRRELTRAKAIHTLRELDHAGTPITFQTVARTAGVSRSWLYAQRDIRVEIERLRDATQQAPSPPIPTSQRASDASLRQRLADATERNRQLAADNSRMPSATSAPPPPNTDPHPRRHNRSLFNNDQPPLNRHPRPHAAASTTPSSTRPPRSQP